jgi:hypothetical protein
VNKGLATNLAAAAITAAGILLPESPLRHAVLATGLFALSGALTNWIAVTMLFERVPGLYGSGIVPARFEDFKAGIRDLILENFFRADHFERLTEMALEEDLDLGGIADEVRYSELFDGLLESVRGSRLGGLLSLVGGDAVLEGLRDPFEREMRKRVAALLAHPHVREVVAHAMSHRGLRRKVEILVDARLAELTPRRVKEIVQKMIRRHLGWLVVWGGVFGGLIGLVASLFV